MDPREPKLPKWAQEELRSLRAKLGTAERLNAELRGQVGETNVLVQNYGADDQPLPEGATILFGLGDEWDNYVTARIEHGALMLHGGRSLAIYPHVSNSVRVKVVQR